MKKSLSLLLTAILIFALTGCNDDKKKGSILALSGSLTEVTADIVDQLGDTVPNMEMKKELELLEAHYYGIDMDGIEDSCFWVNPAGMTPDEIAVIKTKSPENAAELKAFLEDYTQKSYDKWEVYQPAQMHKFDNVIIDVRDVHVAFFICGDSDKALEIYHSLWVLEPMK